LGLLELQLVPFQLRIQLRLAAFKGRCKLLLNTTSSLVICVFNHILML
jgi:hypothetical protein